MINEAELREMSPSERRKLAHSLAAVDYPHPLLGIYLARGRRLGVLTSIIACTVLIGWIIVLVLTLHRSFHAQHWKGAWVGFDLILLAAFAATGWALWRGRQIVIACLIVTGTLLCCDAWFDTTLDWGTHGFTLSLFSALLVELPLAVVALIGARRLLRLTIGRLEVLNGGLGPVPPFWRVPLFVGGYPGSYRTLLRKSDEIVCQEIEQVRDVSQVEKAS